MSTNELIYVANDINLFNSNSMNQKASSNSAKHFSFSITRFLKPKSIQNYQNDLRTQGIKVNIQIKEGKISKAIINIADKLLFIQTKSNKTSKYSFK